MSAHKLNILWIIADEQRTDSLGCYGSPWAVSPAIDRLAASGVVFENAYTPSPVCISARACMFTGRYGSSTGCMNNHTPLAIDQPPFLTDVFAEGGWRTASFGKHHYNNPRKAFDCQVDRVLGGKVGYFEYADAARNDAPGVVRYEGGRSPWIFAGRHPDAPDDCEEMLTVKDALDWLDRHVRDYPAAASSDGNDAPFLLRVSTNAPHTPVVAPAGYDEMIDPDAIDLPLDRLGEDGYAPLSEVHRDYLVDYAGNQRLSDEQIRRARQCYYGRCAYLDYCVGRLIEGLRAAGCEDNTLIVITADHGCHLGDMGFFQKQSFFDPSARVPLIFSGAGIQSPARWSAPVNNGALLATLLEMAGLETPRYNQFDAFAEAAGGRSAPADRPVFSEIDYGLWGYRDGQRNIMARRGDWKLITFRNPADGGDWGLGGDTVLLNVAEDPRETRNLADEPACAEVKARLLADIDELDARLRA